MISRRSGAAVSAITMGVASLVVNARPGPNPTNVAQPSATHQRKGPTTAEDKDDKVDDTLPTRRELRKAGRAPVPEPDADRIWRKIHKPK